MLYFLRHGESVANELNLFAGRFDSPLTSLGESQAVEAATRVAALGLVIDEVHVSPLQRARLTADAVVARLPPNPARRIIETEALLERDFGDLSERNKSLVKKHFGYAGYDSMFHSADGAPPAGESFAAMYSRCHDYYVDVLLPASAGGRHVLVVAHKYIIEMFALLVADLTPADYFDFKIPNSTPRSAADLVRDVQKAPKALNRIGENVEIKLPVFLLLALVAGTLLKQLVGVELAPMLFFIPSLLLLGANAYFAFLRPSTEALAGTKKAALSIWHMQLLRVLVGIGLLLTVHGPLGLVAGLFFLMPPSFAAPTLALMWAADYFAALQLTVALTLLAPLGLAVAWLITPLGAAATGLQVFLFSVMLLAAHVAPAFAAQSQRRLRPIRAGALATNWGWLGAAALIGQAALAGYQLAPAQFFAQLAALTSHSAATYELVLGTSLIGAGWLLGLLGRLKKNSGSSALYLCFGLPNLALLGAALPGGEGRLVLLASIFFVYSLVLGHELIAVWGFGKSLTKGRKALLVVATPLAVLPEATPLMPLWRGVSRATKLPQPATRAQR